MDNNLDYLLNKAYFFLKFRPRTEKEIRRYLQKKIKKIHYSLNDVDKVVDKLKEMGLIDDKNFIDIYVNFYLKNNPKSEKLLTLELRKKGINSDLITDYFSKNKIDEEEIAYKLLKKRWSRFLKLKKEERLKKAVDFLLRRGFSFFLARKTVEKLED